MIHTDNIVRIQLEKIHWVFGYFCPISLEAIDIWAPVHQPNFSGAEHRGTFESLSKIVGQRVWSNSYDGAIFVMQKFDVFIMCPSER